MSVTKTVQVEKKGEGGMEDREKKREKKLTKFSFQTMDYLDYSPWSSKNLIDRNRLKKFMQVRIDVTCMYTDFGGCDPFGFRDTTTLKNGQISLSTHGL